MVSADRRRPARDVDYSRVYQQPGVILPSAALSDPFLDTQPIGTGLPLQRNGDIPSYRLLGIDQKIALNISHSRPADTPHRDTICPPWRPTSPKVVTTSAAHNIR